MKKFQMLILGAAALLAASCSDNSEDFATAQDPSGKPVVLRATIESASRTAINEQGKITWQAGDKISVRLDNGDNLEMEVTEGSYGKSDATFTGVIVGNGKLVVPTVAVYPSGNHTLTAGALSVNMPAVYTVDDNDNTNMPMICEFNDQGNGSFKHLGGVIQFTIGLDYVPEGAAQFRFTVADGQNITGDFTVADGQISATAGTGENSSVTIKFNASQIKDNELIVNVPMPVGTYAGMKLDILDASGAKLMETFGTEKTNKVNRAKRLVMPKLTPVQLSASTEGGEVSNDAEFTAALNSENPNIRLADGNYEKVILPVPNVNPTSGTGTTDDPYYITRSIETMTIDGTAGAKLDGFEIQCGYNTVYKNSSRAEVNSGFNPDLAVVAHPSYYYIVKSIEIGTMTFKNITFTKAFDLHDAKTDKPGNIKADNIVFENVTFDMAVVPSDQSVAARVINKDADIKNITFKNCKFINCANIAKPIAVDIRTTDNVNITVEGCTFDAAKFNAMQFSGTNSNFTGNITIKDNTINNTVDRGIRISTATGNLVITGNTMTDATDNDGEAMKWAGPTASLTFENNTLNGEELEVTVSGTTYVVKAPVPATPYILESDGSYTLLNAEGLRWFADEVNLNGNTFSGKTVRLGDNIDLNNEPFKPIGQTVGNNYRFQGTFDGNNKTISHLYIDSSDEHSEYFASGLFGWTEGTRGIMNLTIDGATVKGHHYVAVVAGWLDCMVTKCHVRNANIECSHYDGDACGDKSGIITGYTNPDNNVGLDNCSATDCTVKAGRDAGQLVGAGYVRMVNFDNCSATNVTVSATGDCNREGNIRNEFIGREL